MNEEFTISFSTPSSDLVFSSSGAQSEGLLGRLGDDIFYSYDPAVNNSESQNVDLLFGDVFDNSSEEFEIATEFQQGNILGILERNIPSVGSDRFVLGDVIQPYYAGNNLLELITTDFLGLNEFAVIYDFESTQDIIQLNGQPEDYLLIDVNNLQIQGFEQPFFGKAIFSLQQVIPDLVAYVIARPEVTLDLNEPYFRFVNEETQQEPAETEVGQLGTIGLDTSFDVATDPFGNVYLTGGTGGSLQGINQGSSDVWVAKYDNNGQPLWIKQFGTSSSEGANAIATDNAGNFYLSGGTSGNLFSSKQSDTADAWVAKYDSDGNLLWSEQFGANFTDGFINSSQDLYVDEQGSVYVSGIAIKENQRTDIFNFTVQDDSWVTKFDSNGNQEWFTEIGSFFFDESYRMTVDGDGNTYLAGWTQGLVEESDPSRELLQYDVWLAKVNPSGQTLWIEQFGSENQGLEFPWGVATDSQNNIYISGWTTGDLGGANQGSYDVWLAKYSPDGNQQWVRQFGTSGDDGSYRGNIVIDSNDKIYLAGATDSDFGGPNAGSLDSWVASYDSDGNQLWVQQFGTSEAEYATGITVDDAGNVFATGLTEGSLGETNAGAVDSWVAKLDADSGSLRTFNPTSSLSLTANSFPDFKSTKVLDTLTSSLSLDADSSLDFTLTEPLDTGLDTTLDTTLDTLTSSLSLDANASLDFNLTETLDSLTNTLDTLTSSLSLDADFSPDFYLTETLDSLTNTLDTLISSHSLGTSSSLDLNFSEILGTVLGTLAPSFLPEFNTSPELNYTIA